MSEKSDIMDGSKMVNVLLNTISFINSMVYTNILCWKHFTTVFQANLENKTPINQILSDLEPFLL
jgi:hypothetical protein